MGKVTHVFGEDVFVRVQFSDNKFKVPVSASGTVAGVVD